MSLDRQINIEQLASILDRLMPDHDAGYRWRLAEELTKNGVAVIPYIAENHFTHLGKEYVVRDVQCIIRCISVDGSCYLDIADGFNRYRKV